MININMFDMFIVIKIFKKYNSPFNYYNKVILRNKYYMMSSIFQKNR